MPKSLSGRHPKPLVSITGSSTAIRPKNAGLLMLGFDQAHRIHGCGISSAFYIIGITNIPA
jgi:hypothetical protein